MHKLGNIAYIHDEYLAPSKDILKRYKAKKISWEEYETAFRQLMLSRNIAAYLKENYVSLDKYCLLCSEEKPDFCHRRLLAEMMQAADDDLQVIHLG